MVCVVVGTVEPWRPRIVPRRTDRRIGDPIMTCSGRLAFVALVTDSSQVRDGVLPPDHYRWLSRRCARVSHLSGAWGLSRVRIASAESRGRLGRDHGGGASPSPTDDPTSGGKLDPAPYNTSGLGRQFTELGHNSGHIGQPVPTTSPHARGEVVSELYQPFHVASGLDRPERPRLLHFRSLGL